MSTDVIEPEAQLGPIAAICDGPVSYRTEGWRKLIHMTGLKFLVNGVQRKTDAVLCLNHNNPTYPTKLYLAENVGGGVNWHETAYILGRQWQTFSWANVSSNQPHHEILAAHLAPLNKKGAA